MALLFLPFVFSFLLFTSQPTNSQYTKINPNDLSALLKIKHTLTEISTSPSSPSFFSTWNFSAAGDPCTSFTGVTCSATTSRVTILTLGTGLSDSPIFAGTLSPAIADLTELTQLILFAGIVTGPIPTQLGFLKNLRVISLTNNRLTGNIPVQILNLPNLHTLDLSRNHLSGSIPNELTELSQLKVLVLSYNKLTGQLPGNLPTQLLHLDLTGNFFWGNLPPQMPASLRYLSLSNNQMWGPLNGFVSLTELTYVDLSMNGFSGSIPGPLFRPGITSIFLQRNNLSGRVPQTPSWMYGVGSTVDLSHNFLMGELTASLIGVESLFLNNNKLTGTVPEGYVDSVTTGSMKTLYLQHNYITGFPLEVGSVIPEAAAVCLSYNCMVAPPVGMAACPVSAGDLLSRPPYQCSSLRNRSFNSLDLNNP